ncbi:MAG: thiamine pyrophosphate-dependent dehydrogenase E1 component subunit alpha [Planctomycetes bacterium]|nr:thiamine pyrophosphate-dependent dehydrogenase E1 component subunit alpha [Planctomycetota bacterium]
MASQWSAVGEAGSQGVRVPRSRITSLPSLERLAILHESGAVDDTLDPHLSHDELCDLHRALLLGRIWDERMITLSRQGRIATYPPTRGQEAASIGPAIAMDPGDWLVPSFREMPAMLLRGWPMKKLILGWWGGHEYGASPPDGVNILPICGPVATQLQHAAGVAWGLKLSGTRDAVVAFVGDGGTSEGDFHEAMNIAGVFRLPLVTIVQNNQWAISLRRDMQTAAETIAQKALAYGFGGVQVDGNDALAMVVATREALERARNGGGPTLIEAVTYRLGEHSTSDNSMKYRTREEVDAWAARDPLSRMAAYLRDRAIVTDAMTAQWEDEIHEEITTAVADAESYEPDPAEPFEHCFATMPPDLIAQRSAFLAQRDDAMGIAASHRARADRVEPSVAATPDTNVVIP